MADMSYCRFENTVKDIENCIEALEECDWNVTELKENASSEYEAKAIERFVKLCKLVSSHAL